MREAIKGRAALSNRDSRFSASQSEFDGGQGMASLVTAALPERAKSIIATNRSPDVPFEQSINPYRGCEHGCIYCFARPTHAYLDLSPGLDFETRLFYKPDAAALLEQALARPGYRCAPIALGTNTDPYQPIEKRYRVTRGILEVLDRCDHPVTIVTKGSLIERDLDLLAGMAARGLAAVMISVTTLDNSLKRVMEPRAAAPAARLGVLRQLADRGIPVGVLVAPLIPWINDNELEDILEASAAAGARSAAYIFLRLPLEVRELFTEWLRQHFPQRASHVMSLVAQSRGGGANDPRFGTRMTGQGAIADLLCRRFRVACRRNGLAQSGAASLDCSRFRPPQPARSAAAVQAGAGRQLPLF